MCVCVCVCACARARARAYTCPSEGCGGCVQVTLGQQTQQGVQVASRSLWDPAVDSHASITYDNKSVFAVAQCYGVYFE